MMNQQDRPGLPYDGNSLALRSNHAVPTFARVNATRRKGFAFFLATVKSNFRLLVKIVALFCVLAVVYALMGPRIYKANVLIHIEQGVQRELTSSQQKLDFFMNTKKKVEAEVGILASRAVLSKAVDDLNLATEVTPNYFPVIGKWIAIRNLDLPVPGLLRSYVWNKGSARLSAFDVPESQLGETFTLAATGGDGYALKDSRGKVILTGNVGTPEAVAAEGGTIKIAVDKMDAKQGAQFEVRRLSKPEAIDKLRRMLVIEEKGPSAELDKGVHTGVISLSVTGEDKQLLTAILDVVSRQYLAQNVDRSAEEGRKYLAFLETQQLDIKSRLEKLEERFSQYRSKNSMVSLSSEALRTITAASELKKRRIELLQKRAEISATYTAEHPLAKQVNEQLRLVDKEIKEITDKIHAFAPIEQEYVRLERELKATNDLKESVANSVRQMRVLSSATINTLRIVDAPTVTSRPVNPGVLLALALAGLKGLLIALSFIVFRKAHKETIDDKDEMDTVVGANADYTTVPHSARQDKLAQGAKLAAGKTGILTVDYPEDAASISLFYISSQIQFLLPHMDNNVVAISSATPNVGKSFISVNVAAAMAMSGKKVLLVDFDLFQPRRKHAPGQEGAHGVAECLEGRANFAASVQRDLIKNLDFLPAGKASGSVHNLLLSQRFMGPLGELFRQYDCVILSTPALLTSADALLIAPMASMTFMVTRAGVTTSEQINDAFRRLDQVGVYGHRLVFNDATAGSRFGLRSAKKLYGSAQETSRSEA